MAGRSRGRNSRFHYVNPRNEHDDRGSRPSTSRGGGYSDRQNFNKKVTFKSNNHFRKSWGSKTDLVRQQLDAEFSKQNGPNRNNSGRRSFPERNNSRHLGNNNFRNSFTLKESVSGWYSIFVPSVEDCDEVLKIIQTYIMPVVFFPYNKQFFDNALRFLVDDFKTAKLLHNTSYKITLRDDRKLVIKVSIYLPPRGPISFTPVSSEVREKMVEAMASRYNSETKCLDLSKFYACPLFTENQLFVPLNRPAVLLAALNIVAHHTKHDLYGLSLANNHIYLGEGLIWIRRLFPELKVLDLSGNKFTELKELRSLAGFNIEVLNLSQNPVSSIEDKEKYKCNVQQYFPMITKLDNTELPSRYNAIIRSKLKMPINVDNSYPVPEGLNPQEPNPLISLVESFLTQFYERYDNDVSRQLAAEAYHENASFTLSSCFLLSQSKGTLQHYMPESRNFLKSDKNKLGRNRFMHKGRENIINFLDKLPKTKHDLGSLVVDVPFANAGMVQIVVNGVFAENYKATDHRHIFRSFCRTFCIVPCGSGWSILSDMMFVTVVTDELLLESSKRFFVPKPTPASRRSDFSNDNNSNSNNVSMFVEDNDEMGGIESSPFQQSATPNYAPPPYQQTTFPAYQQSSIPMNSQQQPPPYPGNMQMPVMQNQSTTNFQPQSFPAPTVPIAMAQQTNLQQSNESFSSGFNSAAFSSTSTVAPASNNQLSAGVSFNSVSDANSNADSKMAMIKSFSSESGMNHEWAKKCLEDNDWDYAKAALCFSKLKEKIPPAAFTQNARVA